jgi:UrcA family protein
MCRLLLKRGQEMKESNIVRKFLVTVTVAALAVPAIAGATPQINDNNRAAVRVSFADLDLSSKAGLRTLYGRLRAASYSVCGSRSLTEAGSLDQFAVNKRCFKKSLSKAVAKFDNETLNEIHAG